MPAGFQYRMFGPGTRYAHTDERFTRLELSFLSCIQIAIQSAVL
jgi:hypothetical protein